MSIRWTEGDVPFILIFDSYSVELEKKAEEQERILDHAARSRETPAHGRSLQSQE